MQTQGTFGSSWNVSAALTHVESIELRDHARSLYLALLGDDHPLPEAPEVTAESARAVRRRARDGFLMALRDGYIRATGRLSTTKAFFPVAGTGCAWRLHSSDLSLIITTEWRAGEFDFSRGELTGPSWQYIQIEMPDFMVQAIWSDFLPEAPRPGQDGHGVSYTTPYLDLMHDAIAHFAITP